MLNQYFCDVFNTTKNGDATEESYYPDIKRLLENWGDKKGKKFYITPLPKRTEAGNPDFRIWDGDKQIVGYIEAKSPDTVNLEVIENSEQLKRYRKTFHNLILTNFFEFRLYREGKLVNQVKIGRPFIIHKLKMIPPVENQEEFLQFLEQFFSFSVPKTTTAKQLAIELAKRTRFLRDHVLAEELKERKIEGTQILEGFYKAFKDHLISSLTIKDFSDLFAQTVTYGLFTARSRAEKGFNRISAHTYIPHTIGILRDVFRFISSTDLPTSMEWIVDDIAEVLNKSDLGKIIHNFYEEGKGKDPIIPFYETFLAEYDPKMREKRGVYFTPEPVVSYIVRSVHKLLKEKFNKEDGFADQSVTVLDPAAGTLTFPAQAIQLAVDEYKNKYGDGGVKSFINDHILKNFYAFELMMAPYAVGHLKIGFVLDKLGYKLSKSERFQLYLTNTLEFTREDPNRLPGIFEKTIARESEQALEIKESIPVMVIIGNPPYSGHSENKGQWILSRMEEYKQVDGEPLQERNPKWLMDDYVKFLRFAQVKIEKTGIGILGFITNHAWLDNPTFRGMRFSLLQTFDEIYILNLHGSTLKKEKVPLEVREREHIGEKDENVFDIQAGVAITLAIKSNKSKKKNVFYSDLWGVRDTKYTWLDNHDVNKTKWQKLSPLPKHYFFVPRNLEGKDKYDQFISVKDILPVNSVGIVTARDRFVIDFEKQSLETRIKIFRSTQENDDFIKNAYQLKDKLTSRWSVKNARQKLRETKDWRSHFAKILYRPFDERWIYYHKAVIERDRKKVMKHMLKPNIALLVNRTIKLNNINHFWITDKINDLHIIETANASAYTFPLYIYETEKEQQIALQLQDQPIKSHKQSNIDQKVFDALKQSFGNKTTPEDIFYYIYAVLYSNTYRKKYKEFLKIDFPRIPFTKDHGLFNIMAKFGSELVDLHLLKHPTLNKPIAKFYGKDRNLVEKRGYNETQKRVYINDQQYFEGVEPDIWNYFIGGYQVLDKWLKDRKGRFLSSEDIKHYCRVVTTLVKTVELQKNIDKIYKDVEEKVIAFEDVN